MSDMERRGGVEHSHRSSRVLRSLRKEEGLRIEWNKEHS